MPTTAQYAHALTAIEKDISANIRELLATHWSFPNHAATASELASAIGAKGYGAVNGRYGHFGKHLRRGMNYYTAPGSAVACSLVI